MMIHLPPTAYRVTLHTSAASNTKIARRTCRRLEALSQADACRLAHRLQELDREWDTERVLEANASALILTGLLLGAVKDRRWYLLSAGTAAFLLEHALQGWCPPLPIIRALGVRTAHEIEEERSAVRADLCTCGRPGGHTVSSGETGGAL